MTTVYVEATNRNSGDHNKVSYSSMRSLNKRGNAKGFYGCSRSSVAGLRKLQRKGQFVKGLYVSPIE